MRKTFVILLAVLFVLSSCLDFGDQDDRGLGYTPGTCVCAVGGFDEFCNCPSLAECACSLLENCGCTSVTGGGQSCACDPNASVCGCDLSSIGGCSCDPSTFACGCDPSAFACSCDPNAGGGCACDPNVVSCSCDPNATACGCDPDATSCSCGPITGGCNCTNGGGPTNPPGCNCNKATCPCGDGCECAPGACDCNQPVAQCTCTDCRCVDCTCTPGNCNCPPEDPIIPTPAPGAFGFEFAKNTLIDTGLALRNGRVLVWGYRFAAHQGNGNSLVGEYARPAYVSSLSGITQVTGSAHSLVAINAAGEAWGWGQNLYGSAGVGVRTGTYVSTPARINGINNSVPPFAHVAAGEYFFVALGTDGSVWTWGHDIYGQLGRSNNSRQDSNVPVKVNLGGETAVMVGSSYEGAFALTVSGNGTYSVWAWGRDIKNSLGFGIGGDRYVRTPTRVVDLHLNASRIVYIDGGYLHGYAVLDNGRVLGWGQRNHLGINSADTTWTAPMEIPIPAGERVIELHARFISTVALTEDATGVRRIYTWGTESYNVGGRSATVRATITDPAVEVEVGGGKHHVYYSLNGTAYGVGYANLNKFVTGNSLPNINWPGVSMGLPAP